MKNILTIIGLFLCGNIAAQLTGDQNAQGLVTNYIDSSVAATTETLPASTASESVRLFTNEDVTNTATLAVQSGETLNGVIDGTFLFSNYSAGTQFRVDEVAGGWVVNVVGASTQTDLSYLSMIGEPWISAVSASAGLSSQNVLDLDDAQFAVTSQNGMVVNGTENTIDVTQGGRYYLQVSGRAGTLLRAWIYVNGVSVARTTGDVQSGDNFSIETITDLVAGDRIEIGTNAAPGSVFAGNVNLQQLPTTESVLAGMVTPTSLDRFMRSRSGYLTSNLWDTANTPLDATVLDVVDVAPSTDNIVDNNDGTVTLKAGNSYKLTAEVVYFANNTLNTSDTYYQWYDGSSYVGSKGASVSRSDAGGGFSSAVHFTGTLGSDATFSVRNSDVDDTGNAFIAGTKIYVEMLPASTVVINTTDIPVDDQATSGYMDIGNMRMQWGIDLSGIATSTVTLPAPFANADYSVTATVETNGTTVYAVGIESFTTTSFDYRAVFTSTGGAAGGTPVRWQAIGLKP